MRSAARPIAVAWMSESSAVASSDVSAACCRSRRPRRRHTCRTMRGRSFAVGTVSIVQNRSTGSGTYRARMARTLAAMLDQRALSLPGRERERAALLRLVRDDTPLVAFVHGIAGVGKSTLLRALAADARASGATTVEVDAREVEPTRRGVLTADRHSGGQRGRDARGARSRPRRARRPRAGGRRHLRAARDGRRLGRQPAGAGVPHARAGWCSPDASRRRRRGTACTATSCWCSRSAASTPSTARRCWSRPARRPTMPHG